MPFILIPYMYRSTIVLSVESAQNSRLFYQRIKKLPVHRLVGFPVAQYGVVHSRLVGAAAGGKWQGHLQRVFQTAVLGV